MVLEHLVIFVPIKEISFGLIGLKEITNPGLKCKSDGMIVMYVFNSYCLTLIVIKSPFFNSNDLQFHAELGAVRKGAVQWQWC
jgi:hypothetical protein